MADRLENAVRSVVDALARTAVGYRPAVRLVDEGRVARNQDGVLRVEGLPSATAEELVLVDGRVPALILGLARDGVDAVALDDPTLVQEGARVRRTGARATIPAGEALLGRVVDPLGRPLDGASLAERLARMPLERPAPAIHERASVHRPLYTGVLAIDAMFPIGRGQRELVVGDEGTGKTAIVLDAMLRQRDTDVVCVYVAIGRRRSETWQVVDALRQGGGRWIVVAAPEDESPGMRFLAPYAGCALAEYFAERGEHALVVYDELTAHAVAWRELSLLLRRPPGREAYPGDVFHVHARLLERATQLSPERGGGSITALPVVLTESGRLSAYIPTNLISITDGQIVLSRDLFAAGQKPAIDAGLSVSRVGAKAQPQAFRELAGRLRLDYAAFLELETFSRLGTRLEASTRRRLEHGRRVRALLKAPRLAPLGVVDSVVRLQIASDAEALVRVPEAEIAAHVDDVAARFRSAHPGLAARIEREAVLHAADREALAAVIAERSG